MKKITALILTILIFIPAMSGLKLSAVSFQPNFVVNSEYAYLVSLDTGDVIYEKNSDVRTPPASLTKIMTAILVLENIEDLENTMITAPAVIFDELYGQNASTADFRHYEVASAKDLMYGMMLQSACEAASILGYYIGGDSVENFVAMMNDKAKEIGALDTHFSNAHGLYAEDQYTTARDMAIITQYAMKLPMFMEISCTTGYDIPPSNKHAESRYVTHTNIMLDKRRGGEYYYEYAKGIKTGTLDEAGRCLVSTASKDGSNYLLVTLKAPLKDEEGNAKRYELIGARNLYNWAFENFEQTRLLSPDEEIGEVAVEFSDGNNYVLVKPSAEYSTLWDKSVDLSTIERKISLAETVTAPVRKGAKLGTMELNFAGGNLITVDLVAVNDVERSELKYNLALAKEFFKTGWFKLAIGILIGLIVLYLVIYIVLTKKNRRRRKIKRVNRRKQF